MSNNDLCEEKIQVLYKKLRALEIEVRILKECDATQQECIKQLGKDIKYLMKKNEDKQLFSQTNNL